MGFTVRNIAEGVYLEQANGDVDFYPNKEVALKLDAGALLAGRTEIADAVGDIVAIEDDVAGAPVSPGATLALIMAQLAPFFSKSDTDYPVSVEKVALATYDFDEHAGAVSEIDLEVSLPSGAIVKEVIIEEEDVLTSAGDGATIELKLGTTAAGDGSITGVLTANNSTSGITEEGTNHLKKTTAIRSLTVEIKVEAITAGKVNYRVIYI